MLELEMRLTMTKYKHLTLSDRNDIQLGLERGETFKAIGQSILKDPTTVSKEVKRNKQVRESTCDNLPCTLLDKAPFVCNGCPKRRQNCGYKKIFYLAKQAQKQYEQTIDENYISYYTIASSIVMLIASVLSGAINISIQCLGYYLGKKDYESYKNLKKNLGQ